MTGPAKRNLIDFVMTPLQRGPRSCLERGLFADRDPGSQELAGSRSERRCGMGSAISPAGFRGAADMRFAIDRLCGPTALASLGVNERDTVDLEENLGLLHEFRAARLSFRKRLDRLIRRSRRGLGIFSLFPGPGPWAAEVAASRQAMILAKAEAASRLQSPGPEELPRDRIPRKGRTEHAGNLAAAFTEDQILLIAERSSCSTRSTTNRARCSSGSQSSTDGGSK